MFQNLSIAVLSCLILGSVLILILLYVIFISLKENEKRAALRAAVLTLAVVVIYSLPLFIPGGDDAAVGLFFVTILSLLLIFFPTRAFEKKIIPPRPTGRINEKNVMFSRNLLKPGTKRFDDYYREFPEHLAVDDHFRKKPGLLSEGSAFYDEYTFNESKAIFDSIEAFYPKVDGQAAAERSGLSPDVIAAAIKDWILAEGAVSVGFTQTKDYHWYSVIGRGKDFGSKARLPHKHAIAFTVDMDKAMMDTAPHGPTVLESATQYLRAATIATSVAVYLRKAGYSARAHIDGNYRVVCPLLARDAGLGEIGRMGLLMTPELGPRVRIGVITTDLPLPQNPGKDHSYMIRFCKICKKCARVCPSHSIPDGDPVDINGVKRWQIDQESCYTYWCIAGTDCGKCMSDCPFSHPNNVFHNAVRWMIRNSLIFSFLAVKMDDFFYGRKPRPKAFPAWIRHKEKL